METPKIDLRVEDCFKQFNRGFNRAKCFSCIMDNLDVTVLPDEWKITNEENLDYKIKPPPDSVGGAVFKFACSFRPELPQTFPSETLS